MGVTEHISGQEGGENSEVKLNFWQRVRLDSLLGPWGPQNPFFVMCVCSNESNSCIYDISLIKPSRHHNSAYSWNTQQFPNWEVC